MPKKLTNEEYLTKLHEINPKIKLIGEYINLCTKILHKCSCGKEWNAAPGDILYGGSKSCGKCISTTSEYTKKLEEIKSLIKVTGEFINLSTKITHQCKCGNKWDVMPSSILTGHTKSCGKCKKQMTEIKVDEIYNSWTIVNIEKNNKENNYKVLCKCSCNRTTQYNYANDLLNNKSTQCKKCSDEKTGIKNRLSHNEYIKRLKELGNIVKVKKGHKYIKNNKKLTHICSICGEDWDVLPLAVLKGQTMCSKCSNSLLESVMAKTLKQILRHYFPNTIWEYDLGFKGENGGISQYDIYVPELNLIIECQSSYHDSPKQKRLDKRKKQFALNQNYSYMEIDHRDFTPLQAIQIFFPYLSKIPSYVDISKNTTRTWSLELAQELMNKGLSYKKIAQEVGSTYNAINHHVCEGKLIKPVGYITQNSRLWDIKKAQSLLNEKKYTYKQIAEILGNKCTNKALESAVQEGLLIRPKYRAQAQNSKIRIPIIQLTLDEKKCI